MRKKEIKIFLKFYSFFSYFAYTKARKIKFKIYLLAPSLMSSESGKFGNHLIFTYFKERLTKLSNYQQKNIFSCF